MPKKQLDLGCAETYFANTKLDLTIKKTALASTNFNVVSTKTKKSVKQMIFVIKKAEFGGEETQFAKNINQSDRNEFQLA